MKSQYNKLLNYYVPCSVYGAAMELLTNRVLNYSFSLDLAVFNLKLSYQRFN